MEEMALKHIHPSKAPYGYVRNKETGHLEIEPIEAQVVKEIFELCKQGNSTRSISTTMKNKKAYLKTGKWTSDKVYKILTNSIYIGIFEYGKYCRKPQDILRVENYCEQIIDFDTWKLTRRVLEKNKHSNYVEHIHLFTGKAIDKKKQQIDPNNDFKECTIELLKKIDCTIEKDEVIFRNKIGFSFIFDSLNRKSKTN